MMQLLAVHFPPQHTDNTAQAQAEARKWVRENALAPGIVIGDFNSSPAALASDIGGRVAGQGIDNAILHGVGTRVLGVRYCTRVWGVRLGSDHKSALRLRLQTPRNQKRKMWFYNVEVGRNHAQVTKEIKALLRGKPGVLVLCETVGYDLPSVKGYVLLRDRSTESRANISVYIKKGWYSGKHQWHNQHQVWERTDHPGTHPARSYLEVGLLW